MINIGKQIAAWRKSKRLTQEALQDLCGWGDGNSRISHYENGRSEPGLNEINTIASRLGINIKTLIFELPGDKSKQSEENVNRNCGESVVVPVYSLEKAHEWRSMTMDDAVDTLIIPNRYAAENAYVVQVPDDSCHPFQPVGTPVLITQGKPNVGSLVLATLPEGHNAFRVFKRPTQSGYELHPLNDDYATHKITDPNREKILGIAAFSINHIPKY